MQLYVSGAPNPDTLWSHANDFISTLGFRSTCRTGLVNDRISADEIGDFRLRLRSVEDETGDNSAAIKTHEAVCAERYKAINLRLNVLVYSMIFMGLAQIFGMQRAAPILLKLLGLG